MQAPKAQASKEAKALAASNSSKGKKKVSSPAVLLRPQHISSISTVQAVGIGSNAADGSPRLCELALVVYYALHKLNALNSLLLRAAEVVKGKDEGEGQQSGPVR